MDQVQREGGDQRQEPQQQQWQQHLSPSNISTEDPKMILQNDELQWAHQIKARIIADDKLHNLTDFDYAQWAIVTMARQDMNEVLDRAYKLQCFLEEYKLSQAPDISFVEAALDVFQGYFRLMPGYLLCLDYCPDQKHFLVTFDWSAMNVPSFKTEHDWRIMLVGLYFIFQITNSNLLAIREGMACIVECMGMGFHNCSQYVIERLSTNLCAYYPYKAKEFLFLNSPMAANILLALVKPFFPEEIKRTFQIGHKLEGFDGKIDVLFQQPTPELAQAALLKHIELHLIERIKNQQTYKLPLLTTY